MNLSRTITAVLSLASLAVSTAHASSPPPGMHLEDWRLSYDTVGNIESRDAGSTTSYLYDNLDRLTKETGPVHIDDFTYDANGNRESFTRDGLFEYYINDVASNQLDQVGTDIRTYDAAGNLTSDRNGTRVFTYSDAGRLSSVTENGILLASYTYNAQGQRVTKTVSGVTSYFIYDAAGQLLGEYDATGQPVTEYVHLNGEPMAQLDSGITYLHSDHLGTPRRATDSTGEVVWSWDSDAFGSTAADEDPDGDLVVTTVNLRFPGQQYDSETGLHYNYFRTYDPSTGRYLESDPIGLAGGLNTYGYVGGNPLSFVDPLGLQAKPRDTVEAFCLRYPAECASVIAGGGAYVAGQQLADIASNTSSSTTTGDPENCPDDDDDDKKCDQYKADARRMYNRLAADKIPEYMRSVRVGEGDVGHHMQIIQRQSALRVAVAGVRRHCKNPPLELAKWERLAYQEFPTRHAP